MAFALQVVYDILHEGFDLKTLNLGWLFVQLAIVLICVIFGWILISRIEKPRDDN